MAKKRVLIIDDDSTIRGMVRLMLEAEGYEVLDAHDGPTGLAILQKEPRPLNFTLFILDVSMPNMSGLDVLTRLKLHSDTSRVPVVMLTGEAKTEDVMAGYAQGAEYYITKPFTREQLVKGLEYVLNPKPS